MQKFSINVILYWTKQLISTYIHPKNNLVIMLFNGDVSSDDLKDNFDLFTSYDHFKFNMDSLIILNGSNPKLKASDLIDYINYVQSRKVIRGDDFKIAIVSEEISSFRFIKLFEMSSKNRVYNTRHFTSAESASKWLLNKRINLDLLLKNSSVIA
ncbi:MAG: hypothetical protein KDD94_04315 [Calditrichaeota bacterium]|nr:hypothetical protein [Calditrichota bacterium]